MEGVGEHNEKDKLKLLWKGWDNLREKEESTYIQEKWQEGETKQKEKTETL